MAKVILTQEAGEGSDHAEIIGDHLLGGADQKNQPHGAAVLGFEIDALAAAPDGDEDVGALVGAGVGDGHIVTEGGVTDPLALEAVELPPEPIAAMPDPDQPGFALTAAQAEALCAMGT